MSGWNGGYVTDITYTAGYYRHQSPAHLAVACLLGGVQPPALKDGLSYLELGCGQGLGALILAASNPTWQVTAIDFNPAHIAAAKEFALEAGLENICFLEADLSTLADGPLAALVPRVDYVSLHGLWSWVPQPVRDGIVRLLRDKMNPGALVHLSYNALPAWQGALGMQRILRETGLLLARRSDMQAIAGLQVVQALSDAGAPNVSTPWVRRILEKLGDMPAEYLAHEYMLECWNPCFHTDVAQQLADAKLDWVSSAQLVENFSDLTLSDAQRAVLNRFEDPPVRELIKDMCLERGLRQDVFVRGARRLDRPARDQALRQMVVALTVVPEDFSYEIGVPAGQATLEPAFYRPVVEALAERPRSIGELLSLPGVVGKRDNPAELIGMLVGTDQALPVARTDLRQPAATQRFNAIAAARLVRTDQLNRSVALAHAGLGTGVPCHMLDLYVVARLQEGQTDPDEWVADLGQDRSEEDRKKLRDFLDRVVQRRVPTWRQTGVV
jgi:SAM-dependent methyltransferase